MKHMRGLMGLRPAIPFELAKQLAVPRHSVELVRQLTATGASARQMAALVREPKEHADLVRALRHLVASRPTKAEMEYVSSIRETSHELSGLAASVFKANTL